MLMWMSICAALHLVVPQESAAQDTQASLRVSINESYEKVRTAKQQLDAAEQKYESIEAKELAKVIKLLRSLAEIQTKSGQLADAKESYAKLLQYEPNNAAAGRFFESTGAESTKNQILTKQYISNAEAALNGLSTDEARKWVLAAASVTKENPRLGTLLSQLDAIERAMRVAGNIETRDGSEPAEWHSKQMIDGKPKSVFKKRVGRQWFEVLRQDGKVYTNNYLLIEYANKVASLKDTGAGTKIRIHQDGAMYFQRPGQSDWTLGYYGDWQR